MMKRKHILKYTACLLLMTCFSSSYAQTYTEAEIKSAFICNFAKFTEWPSLKFPKDTSSVIIGVVGYDAFGEALIKVVKSTQVGKRKIRIIKINQASECKNIHLLYVGVLKDQNHTLWLDACRQNSVLSISEYPDFCKLGGMIQFSQEKTKYGFKISPKNAETAKLSLSAKLLNLAVLVE
jgi:hypothetical protein